MIQLLSYVVIVNLSELLVTMLTGLHSQYAQSARDHGKSTLLNLTAVSRFELDCQIICLSPQFVCRVLEPVGTANFSLEGDICVLRPR